jgi:drug/metabolite transporter (DMT)-like permease
MKLNIKVLYSYVALLIAPLLWSGNFAIGRAMHAQIPPLELSFYRWLLVIFLLFPFVSKSLYSNRIYILNEWKKLFLLSLLSVSTYTSCIYFGLRQTTVINAALLNGSVPVLIILLSTIVLKDKLTLFKLLGAISSIIGVFILILSGNLSNILNFHLNEGDFYVVIAAISWALFSVLYKKFKITLPPFAFLFVTAVIGECILLLPYLIEINIGYSMRLNFTTLFSILYAGIFSSIIAFTLWNFGVRNIGPTKAGYFFNLLPVFSFILAVAFLNEQFHYYQIFGSLFIFVGILIALNSKKENQIKILSKNDIVTALKTTNDLYIESKQS